MILIISSTILGTTLKIDKGRTKKKGPENKEVEADVQGFTSERRYRPNVNVKKSRRKMTG